MNLVGLFHMLRVPDRISTTFTRISSQKVSFHEAHWIESAPFRQHCGVACELLGTMLQIEVDGHRMYSEGHKPNDSSSLQPVLREGVYRIGPDAEAIVISASLVCTQDGSAAEYRRENENKGDRSGCRQPFSGRRGARLRMPPGASAFPLTGEIGEVNDRA